MSEFEFKSFLIRPSLECFLPKNDILSIINLYLARFKYSLLFWVAIYHYYDKGLTQGLVMLGSVLIYTDKVESNSGLLLTSALVIITEICTMKANKVKIETISPEKS